MTTDTSTTDSRHRAWSMMGAPVEQVAPAPTDGARAHGHATVPEDAAARSRVVGLRCRSCQRTEVTGPIALRVWVSATEGDADLMVVLRHLDEQGVEIEYPAAVDPWIGAGYGWLRVSHRELDPTRSELYRPYHRHVALDPPAPDETVLAAVEILPTCLVFEPGHSLVLQIGSQVLQLVERFQVQKVGSEALHSGEVPKKPEILTTATVVAVCSEGDVRVVIQESC